MTAYTDSLVSMRAQAKAEIDGAAASCTVSRFNPSTDASGKKTGSYSNLSGSSLIWIQPLAGTSDIQAQGINAETTHVAFQAYDGRELLPKDRVLVAGGTYVYDVIDSFLFDTHRMSELKQVRRF